MLSCPLVKEVVCHQCFWESSNRWGGDLTYRNQPDPLPAVTEDCSPSRRVVAVLVSVMKNDWIKIFWHLVLISAPYAGTVISSLDKNFMYSWNGSISLLSFIVNILTCQPVFTCILGISCRNFQARRRDHWSWIAFIFWRRCSAMSGRWYEELTWRVNINQPGLCQLWKAAELGGAFLN